MRQTIVARRDKPDFTRGTAKSRQEERLNENR
jgi:hypothetical protein